MSKIKDELKLLKDSMPDGLPFDADARILQGLLGASEAIEKAAAECNLDKVFSGVIEVEWHRQSLGHLADRLQVDGQISDMDRVILRTTALAVERKVLQIAENTLINHCRCNFQ